MLSNEYRHDTPLVTLQAFRLKSDVTRFGFCTACPGCQQTISGTYQINGILAKEATGGESKLTMKI